MKTKIMLSLAVALTAALLSQPILAKVTYAYTGNPFTTVTAPYTTSDMVTGSVEFSSPLPANMPLTTVTPLSFSFSDGVQTIAGTITQPGFSGFQFGTGPSGAITAWTIYMQSPTGGIGTDNGGSIATGDSGGLRLPPPGSGNTHVPGTWTTPLAGGYTVTLDQVGPNVVATGHGAINLTGLTFANSTSLSPEVHPSIGLGPMQACNIYTGLPSSIVDSYVGGLNGPTSFGSPAIEFASSGSGDMVGIAASSTIEVTGIVVAVPSGYVSGTALSDLAIYSGKTLATLGLTPGTYVWTWGAGGVNQNFTLKILAEVLSAANITNFSTRASVQTGQGVTIAGFIISGTGSKSLVVRGLGSTLAQPPFNVQGVLADPTLQLFDSGGHPFWFNDNWKDTQQGQIQSTGLAPPNDLESGILQTLQPGNYTAVLSGKNDTTGVGLVELYDINPSSSAELTNVSTRGFVGTGDDVLIAGFISNGSTQVVVRGLGPTLAQPQFGVPGALADPVVTLVDGNGNVIQTNDNWKNTQQAAIQATGFAPPDDLEAAIFAPVAAGNYTAILSSNGGGTGIGLVEVYKL